MMNNRLLILTLLKPELKSLSGKRYSHVIILFIIYLFSIFCIGSSIAILKYLDDKMDNSYVKMVDAPVNTQLVDLDKVVYEFVSPDIREEFHIEDVDAFIIDYMNFSKSDASPKDSKVLKIGVINDVSHPIWEQVLENADKYIPNENIKPIQGDGGARLHVRSTDSLLALPQERWLGWCPRRPCFGCSSRWRKRLQLCGPRRRRSLSSSRREEEP